MEALKTVLDGVKVVDLGTGMGPALVARFLADAGAQVTRVRPAADPFASLYPADVAWREGVQTMVADSPGAGAVGKLLADADICIVGGEDHPELDWRADPVALLAANPGLVVLDLSGDAGGARAEGPAVEILAQARSGIAYEHYSDRPLCYGFQ